MMEEVETESSGNQPPRPPVVETAPSSSPDDWTSQFDVFDMIDLQARFEAIMEEVSQDDAIVAVRIPYATFHRLFELIHMTSLEGSAEVDPIGQAMADMYMFDPEIAATPECGAATAYFMVDGDDDED